MSHTILKVGEAVLAYASVVVFVKTSCSTGRLATLIYLVALATAVWSTFMLFCP